MPALIMRRALFIHVPKTGGHFVQKAIAELGVQARPPRGPHFRGGRDHPTLTEVQLHRWFPRPRFTFGFVRYPPDWWRSYWAYRMRTGWVSEMDAAIQADEFPIFIEKVLKHYPGVASMLFERYVGAPGTIDFVGRCESLREDLVRALSSAGYEADPLKLNRIQRQNISDYRIHSAEYPPELLRKLAIAERRGIEQWYPERLSEAMS